MTDRVCFSNTCSAAMTKLLDVGWKWPDGRPRYVHACDQHVQKVVDFQRESYGITVTLHDVGQVELVYSCAAAWRSHACGLPDDHSADHICDPGDCDDSPTAADRVFHAYTETACARRGGVRP